MELEYATYYSKGIPTSRIDMIWFDHDLIVSDYCFTRTWLPSVSQLTTDSSYNLDHRCVTTYFTKSLLIPFLPTHRIKQKKEWKKFYDTVNTTDEQWENFRQHIICHLAGNTANTIFPENSTLPAPQVLINHKWSILRKTIVEAADRHIPIRRCTADFFKPKQMDFNIRSLESDIR